MILNSERIQINHRLVVVLGGFLLESNHLTVVGLFFCAFVEHASKMNYLNQLRVTFSIDGEMFAVAQKAQMKWRMFVRSGDESMVNSSPKQSTTTITTTMTSAGDKISATEIDLSTIWTNERRKKQRLSIEVYEDNVSVSVCSSLNKLCCSCRALRIIGSRYFRKIFHRQTVAIFHSPKRVDHPVCTSDRKKHELQPSSYTWSLPALHLNI